MTPVVPVSPDTPVEIETPKQPSENTDNAGSSNEKPDAAGESENSTGSDSNKIPENSVENVSHPTQSNQVAAPNEGTNKVALTPNTAAEFVNPVNNPESKVAASYGSSESKYSAPAKVQEKEAEGKSKSDDKKEELPSTGTVSSVMSVIGAALAPFSTVLLKKRK
ncbi:LPXTG cell wall anchor domain-containing protein [Streptococcus danieliae]|uniref:LPXTG cell wall anchor domain-containing protein n=1 Tax=Streptococcus danieliae TaxID=747656 RepID=A0A7Z0M4Z0_9STRE|nr:LPXTG cell wall anchor domain-containing protein [Streptococcus danieliae]MBF0698803.1 LPXTG cell wall anchor domain-containing protein [Streptococcus danieliae]NYS95980.1 LPXTG cell wall anchor domain-containing protein [Streptococcus danieliae]